ncbi:MAG: hypothetical protein MJB14_18740 [Spirochaetes bacterium]|nr:hypothetical protein [Spirochaetota bacterium]
MIIKGNKDKKIVDSKTRAQLIRKGNEFFTQGNITAAEKIFVTVDYKDGILRLADYYFENHDLYKACDMYFRTENNAKISAFCEQMAKAIQKMLNEDKKYPKIIMEKEHEEK